MPNKKYPSIDLVRQCLRYKEGQLFWMERPREHFVNKKAWATWNAKYAGKEAGCKVPPGHCKYSRWVLCINYIRMHRFSVVWALHYNKWVIGIDHRNRNPLDDRIENLRLATQSENRKNSSIMNTNTSGFKGASWHKYSKKWRATIYVNKKHIHLGCFNTPELAHEAYMKAANKYFGEFATNGK